MLRTIGCFHRGNNFKLLVSFRFYEEEKVEELVHRVPNVPLTNLIAINVDTNHSRWSKSSIRLLANLIKSSPFLTSIRTKDFSDPIRKAVLSVRNLTKLRIWVLMRNDRHLDHLLKVCSTLECVKCLEWRSQRNYFYWKQGGRIIVHHNHSWNSNLSLLLSFLAPKASQLNVFIKQLNIDNLREVLRCTPTLVNRICEIEGPTPQVLADNDLNDSFSWLDVSSKSNGRKRYHLELSEDTMFETIGYFDYFSK